MRQLNVRLPIERTEQLRIVAELEDTTVQALVDEAAHLLIEQRKQDEGRRARVQQQIERHRSLLGWPSEQ